MLGKEGIQLRDASLFPMNRCNAVDHPNFILKNHDL